MGSTFFQNKHINFLHQNEFFAPQMLYKIGHWVFAYGSQEDFLRSLGFRSTFFFILNDQGKH
jgi:hypothetical protein